MPKFIDDNGQSHDLSNHNKKTLGSNLLDELRARREGKSLTELTKKDILKEEQEKIKAPNLMDLKDEKPYDKKQAYHEITNKAENNFLYQHQGELPKRKVAPSVPHNLTLDVTSFMTELKNGMNAMASEIKRITHKSPSTRTEDESRRLRYFHNSMRSAIETHKNLDNYISGK